MVLEIIDWIWIVLV